MEVKRVFSKRNFAKQWDDLTVEDLYVENYPDNELSTIESFEARPDFTWSEWWELVGKGRGQEPFVVVQRRWNGEPLDVYPPEKWEDIKEEYDFACGGKKKFAARRPKGYLCKRNFAKNIKIPQKKLEEWAEMVNENEHTLVGASIADFLAQYDENYKKYSDFFNLIEKHSDKEGHLAYPGGWLRPLLYDKLYEDIEYDFGKKVLSQIKSI